MPPIDGTRSAAAALRYLELKQQVVANNLANVSTAAFKGERVFARLLDGAMPMGQTATNLSVGELERTGDAFDIALRDDSFLVIDTPAGERWSRGGTLRLDDKQQLVTTDGHAVLGDSGAIELHGAAPFEITREGKVVQNGAVVGTLRVERPGTAGGALVHEAGTRYVPPANRVAVDAADRSVEQGLLEASNVNSMTAMVDMIGVQRAYGAVHKALVELDKVHETAATQLARPV